ncbi:hypothetical protein NPX13_g5028 [Xylaria arbuscula]|uniref:Rhodopsin domain-containing protein n=1 Tax=Xylaria arbuscula TaxID=114810 RepID=A0A9W8TLN8_9PEZI|nr:hypothetical protein NPX13_g5028 [Xylaria arbuscula]
MRIFASRDFKVAAHVVEGIVLAWWIAIFFSGIFQCDPISKAWLPETRGKCIILKGYFYGNAVPNILTDFIILSLPIRQVLKLQTDRANKLSISVIFLLGSFVSFSSIYRFTTLLVFDPLDPTWTLAPSQAWCMIEISTGVVSACLPTLRPLAVRLATVLGISRSAARSKPTRPVNLVTFGSGDPRQKRGESLQHSQFSRLDDEESDSPERMAGVVSPVKRRDEQQIDIEHYGRDPAVHATKPRCSHPNSLLPAMAPEDDYVFTRDFLDNIRIPIQGADLKVADVGCGTGLPSSTQFVGLDISLDAIPPAGVLPPNVAFRVWDMIHDPVPEELVGSFDMINIRLMLYVLQKDDVPATVNKLMKMLKTGGYLQWMDVDNETVRGEVTKTENTSDNMTQMMKLLDSQGEKMKPKWVPDLAQIFSDSGLVDVDADVHTSQPLWAYLEHECLLLLPELIARKTQNEQLATEFKRLLPLAEQETRKGAYLAVEKYIVTGKKA